MASQVVEEEGPQTLGLRLGAVASISEAPARFALTLGEDYGIDG